MIDSKRIFTPEIVPMYELNEEITKAIDLGESTGYKTLDNILGGLRLGELLVITADTGSGKSTFCTNLIVHLAKNNNPIWVNSYEMDYRVIGRKIASVALKKNLRYKEFTDQEDMELAAWTLKHPVFINPISRGQSVKELRNTIEMAAFAYGIKYIFIDHLDYIKARGERDSVLENIDEAMRELHQIALEFRVSIILVVHPVQIKEKRELTIHDLKGSSSIKQYADNIIILTRLDNLNPNDKGFVKIDVVKNRLFGKQQFFKMKYNYETDTYSEADCGIY
jgi:twinkle protein